MSSFACYVLHITSISNQRSQVTNMVGPPGFEPGSDDPQPPSIDQANLRALLCLIARLLTERSNLMNKV